jgi:hypothetical protein
MHAAHLTLLFQAPTNAALLTLLFQATKSPHYLLLQTLLQQGLKKLLEVHQQCHMLFAAHMFTDRGACQHPHSMPQI